MADTNLITKTDLRVVREQEFVLTFEETLKKLTEALALTRKVEKQAGTTLYTYKVTGTLEDGEVEEGEVIPLSKYQTVKTPVGEITIKKWRKGTTYETIVERGFNQAVLDTNAQMSKDIAKGIRKDFFDLLKTGSTAVTGTTFQSVLAGIWGKLAVLFEDDDVNTIYFMNPLDIAEYLASANVTIQTAFGLSYIENFLGLGTVVLNSSVEKGKIYGTASDNIILYYVAVNGADTGNAFNFTTDETGYIGIHEEPNYDNLTDLVTAVSGVAFFPEQLGGIVVGTITGA